MMQSELEQSQSKITPNDIADYLRKCSKAYYNGTSLITDEKYDKLRDKLEQMDPDHQFLVETGAPLPVDGWPTHKHKSFFSSLHKVNSYDDFMKWATNKGDKFTIVPKYDGCTMVATYEDGKLLTVATRGDGTVGEDLTDNAIYIPGVDPALADHEFTGEVRGELMLQLDKFDKHFKPLGCSNPRNTANGKIRHKGGDPLIEHLDIFWFDVIPEDKTKFETEEAKWQWLNENGLSPDYPGPSPISAEKAWDVFVKFRDETRASLNYDIDGMVVKVSNLELQESLGLSSNRPKGAIAIKFPALQKITTLRDIEWNRGLSGIIAPVGLLEPVSVGGVTISRVSLCGMDEIKRLDIAVGDEVLISRRNDVIPKIEKVITKKELDPEKRQQSLKTPATCMECNQPVAFEGAYLICSNQDCQGEVYGNLMTWIRELQIKGIGPAILRALINLGVTDVVKLYQASRDQFNVACNSEINGEKRYNTIQSSKTVRFSTFLSALNIKSLGTTNGQRLESHFKNLDNLLKATVDELSEVQGIKTNSKKILAGLVNKATLIQDLRSILDIQTLSEAGPLSGSSVCITGELSLPRPVIQEWIKKMGGESKSSVSNGLTYLLTNDKSTNTEKNQKADKYGVKKVTEEEFYQIVGTKPEEQL